MSGPHQDTGPSKHEGLRLTVLEGRLDTDNAFRLSGEADQPTLVGVRITQAPTFIDERRTLVVSYNSQEPPGTLGYTVMVRPGYAVGDHYHHQRVERILVLHGRAQFRLLDQRPGSPTYGLLNVFTLDHPGACVDVPTGVGHAIVADGQLTVLQVLASTDYDATDDVHVTLSPLPLVESRS